MIDNLVASIITLKCFVLRCSNEIRPIAGYRINPDNDECQCYKCEVPSNGNRSITYENRNIGKLM